MFCGDSGRCDVKEVTPRRAARRCALRASASQVLAPLSPPPRRHYPQERARGSGAPRTRVFGSLRVTASRASRPGASAPPAPWFPLWSDPRRSSRSLGSCGGPSPAARCAAPGPARPRRTPLLPSRPPPAHDDAPAPGRAPPDACTCRSASTPRFPHAAVGTPLTRARAAPGRAPSPRETDVVPVLMRLVTQGGRDRRRCGHTRPPSHPTRLHPLHPHTHPHTHTTVKGKNGVQ